MSFDQNPETTETSMTRPRPTDKEMMAFGRMLMDPRVAEVVSRPSWKGPQACRLRMIYVELMRVLRERPLPGVPAPELDVIGRFF